MALNVRAIRGTQDTLPNDSYKINFAEFVICSTAESFGYKEIRTPVFENTELFQRSVGDTTDVVQKEMYTFEDKGGRSITLRPEGTAGAVRSMLEHGLYNDGLPQKVYYLTSCYRYEKPQAGRLREFHQFGIECFGAKLPTADAEIISLAYEIFESFNLKDEVRLEINSIGCPKCRAKYHEALKEYFRKNQENLCQTCVDRLDRNPMRILDCKSPVCSEISADAPVILDYICDECSEHFDGVKKMLSAMNIEFTVNPKIVRGLDYYTRTVFEFVTTKIGAQGTVCGGGRYDGLVKEMGGPDMPSLGFGMGVERLMLLLESTGFEFPDPKKCDLYIAPLGDKATVEACKIAKDLRDDGNSVQTDLAGRSLKAQMKYADKIGADYTLVLGDNEIEVGMAEVKNMQTGEKTPVKLSNIAEDFNEVCMDAIAHSIACCDGLEFKKDEMDMFGGLL